MHGGKFMKDLSKKCTHLIASEAKGKKYIGALKWGIPVVSLRWFEDCVSSKGRMNGMLELELIFFLLFVLLVYLCSGSVEKDYLLIADDAGKSTSFIDSEISRVTGNTINAAEQKQKEVRLFIICLASSLNSEIDTSTHNSQNDPKSDNVNQRATSSNNNSNNVSNNNSHSNSNNEEDEDEYPVMFLDGCKIFLLGFPQKDEQLLIRIITSGTSPYYYYYNIIELSCKYHMYFINALFIR